MSTGIIFFLALLFIVLIILGFTIFAIHNTKHISSKTPLRKELLTPDTQHVTPLNDFFSGRNASKIEVSFVESEDGETAEMLEFYHHGLKYQITTSVRETGQPLEITSSVTVIGRLATLNSKAFQSESYIIDIKNHFWCEEQAFAKLVQMMDSEELPDLLNKNPL